MNLAPLEHVPHVQVGEVAGDPGRVIVCVADDSDVALVMVGVSTATLTSQSVRELIELLTEAASCIETRGVEP